MKRLALSLVCVWAASTAGSAQAQWIDFSWSTGPTWSTSYYNPWYSSYYSPSYSYYTPYTSYYGGYSSYYGGCSTCGTGCNSCGTGCSPFYSYYGSGCGCSSCGSSCGYGCSSCGTGCGYGCSSCGPGCGSCGSCYGNCGVGSCYGNCSAGNCGAGCGTNCNTGNAPLDSRGNPTPAPDNRYQRDQDGGRYLDPAINPNRTMPDTPTYDRDRPAGTTRNPLDSEFRPSNSRESRPMDMINDGLDRRLPDPLNRPRDGGLDRDSSDMFGNDSHKTNKPADTIPVPQRNPGLNGPDAAPPEDGSRSGVPSATALRHTASTPARALSLDNAVTWRALPERTRMKIRSTFATPVVARAKVDSNSEWSPVPTQLVRK